MKTEGTEVANTLNMQFETAVNSIGTTENKYILTETGNLEGPIKISIKTFENHPSLLSIKKILMLNNIFSFQK